LVKPKLVGDFIAQDMTRMAADDDELAQVASDFLIRLRSKGPVSDRGSSSNLEILQGDMKIRE
jgi:hypothetical protein